MVRTRVPPRTSTMPKLVEQNSSTTAAAEPMDGASAGSVTVRHARKRPAPRVRAASAVPGSRDAQAVPTTLATTDTLKNTSAHTIATTDWSRPAKPRIPRLENSALKAAATTTVGNTNGTATIALAAIWPRQRKRYSAHAAGSPKTRDPAVPKAASETVVTTASGTPGEVSTSHAAPVPVPSNPRTSTEISGQTKKTARNAAGTATTATHVR